ncbi:hypothetical protein KIN20_024693 [Parelaphostrongylus tenuis]|uniref:Uncharacterized protein n=1 Tax=Parelaphostrongylus tenuis TaxID=148309 RepID=A0AAD5QXN1_PARTN|nr:hypothetical protein KIN20_024693 [Parelaphostrongylus tenuis]
MSTTLCKNTNLNKEKEKKKINVEGEKRLIHIRKQMYIGKFMGYEPGHQEEFGAIID